MRILFAASAGIAVPALRAIAARHEIVGILTNPESEQGRGRVMAATPVAAAAAELNSATVAEQSPAAAGSLSAHRIPVLTFPTLRAEAREAVVALRPELLVTFAYGRIFGPRFLELFPRGGINIHPSLLPRHRGATPIPAAILARDAETGVCVQKISLELDAGDILASTRFPLTGKETTGSLSAFVASIGASLVVEVLDALETGSDRAIPQAGEPTYCPLLGKSDGLIDWNSPVSDIDARIRAFDPWPGAYTYLQGKKLDILEAVPHVRTPGDGPRDMPAPAEPPVGTIVALDKSEGLMVQTNDGLLAVRRLRFSTRKALSWKEFANGVRGLAGARLGGPPEDATAS